LPSNVVAAQIVGAPIGLALLVTLYPAAARTADRAVIHHERHNTESRG